MQDSHFNFSNSVANYLYIGIFIFNQKERVLKILSRNYLCPRYFKKLKRYGFTNNATLVIKYFKVYEVLLYTLALLQPSTRVQSFTKWFSNEQSPPPPKKKKKKRKGKHFYIFQQLQSRKNLSVSFKYNPIFELIFCPLLVARTCLSPAL